MSDSGDGRRGSRPRLNLGSHLAPGLVAVALFVVMAAVFAGASFGTAAGFEDTHVAQNVSVTSNTSANVTTAVQNDSLVAVVNGNETVTVSDDPGANVSIVEQYGEIVAQVIEPTSVTASLGYAMFNLESPIESEGFLVAFEIIDIVLVAAVVAAVMLGRAESGKRVSGGLTGQGLTDGGRDVSGDRDAAAPEDGEGED